MRTGSFVRTWMLLPALVAGGCDAGGVEVGFWLEPVSVEAPGLGGALTSSDLAIIRSVALGEMVSAFEGLRLEVSDRRDARYRVKVVDRLRHPATGRPAGGAGQASAVRGFGGSASVSLTFLVDGALFCAPHDADRAAVIEAIGRGVGRTAVHEITHMLLPTVPIHADADIRSYEHASAARCEHYGGELHWDTAWPGLMRRLGSPRAGQVLR